MAIEAKRGCGYRKVGGLYLCGEGSGHGCCKMPIILHVCPTCAQGLKQSRQWQWIDPRPWIKGACKEDNSLCPAYRADGMGERVGLLWIGTQFYRTPEAFAEEANRMGVSRRIKAVPRGFKVGEHWVWFAHPRVKQVYVSQPDKPDSKTEWQGGVFRIFKPSRIEKLITQSDSEDEEVMAALEKQGITPVIVPDDDKDHQGSIYDDATDDQQEMRI